MFPLSTFKKKSEFHGPACSVLPQLEMEIPFLSSQISLDFDQIPWIRVLSPICVAWYSTSMYCAT